MSGGGAKGFLSFLEGPLPPVDPNFVPTKLPDPLSPRSLAREHAPAKDAAKSNSRSARSSSSTSPSKPPSNGVRPQGHSRSSSTTTEDNTDGSDQLYNSNLTTSYSQDGLPQKVGFSPGPTDAAVPPAKAIIRQLSKAKLPRRGGVQKTSSSPSSKTIQSSSLDVRDSVEIELSDEPERDHSTNLSKRGEPNRESAEDHDGGEAEHRNNVDISTLSTFEVLRNAGIQSTCRQLLVLEEKNFLITAARTEAVMKIRQAQKEIAALEAALEDLQSKSESLDDVLKASNDYRDQLQLCDSLADLQTLITSSTSSAAGSSSSGLQSPRKRLVTMAMSTLRLNDDDGTIRGGTVKDLVEMVTNNLFFSARFNTAFLKTYNGFTNSETLCSLLIDRWNTTFEQAASILVQQKRLQLNSKVNLDAPCTLDDDVLLLSSDDDSTSSDRTNHHPQQQTATAQRGTPQKKPPPEFMSALQALNVGASPVRERRRKKHRSPHKDPIARLSRTHYDSSADDNSQDSSSMSESSSSLSSASSSAPMSTSVSTSSSSLAWSSMSSLSSPLGSSSSLSISSPQASRSPTLLAATMPTSPPLLDYTPAEADVTRVRTQIRLRVLAFTKQWLKESWDKDFDGSPVLVCRVVLWLDQSIADGDRIFVPTLQSLRGQVLKNLFEGPKTQASLAKTPYVVPKDFPCSCTERPDSLDIFLLEPLEIAKQFTIFEQQLFQALRLEEFFDQNWNRSHKSVSAPNLTKLINRINVMSAWVSTSICSISSKKHRAARLEKWIRVASAAKDLGNLNCVMEILSGLGQTSIYRLKRTWHAVDQRLRATYQELRLLMSPNSNFANYRRFLRRASGPCIPYVGSLLTDLTFLDEAMPKYLDDDASSEPIVNFHKYQKVHALIDIVLQFQSQQFAFQPIDSVQTYLASCVEPNRFASDMVLFTVSKILEP